jgi:hypothetical protein
MPHNLSSVGITRFPGNDSERDRNELGRIKTHVVPAFSYSDPFLSPFHTVAGFSARYICHFAVDTLVALPHHQQNTSWQDVDS